MAKQRFRIGAVYLVVVWDDAGRIYKHWCEGKRLADRTAKSCRDDRQWPEVLGPIGPFHLRPSPRVGGAE